MPIIKFDLPETWTTFVLNHILFIHTIWQFALCTVTSISEWNKITTTSSQTLQWKGVYLQNLSHNISNIPKSQSLKEPTFTHHL